MAAFRAFSVNWRVKGLLFQAFDKLPFGQALYFLVQKHVTKTVPRRLSPTADTASCFIEHAAAMRERWGDTLPARRIFEFGAGWDLYGNLVLWCYGIERQVVYDLTEYARAEEINVVIRHLARDPPPGAARTPRHEVQPGPGWAADLARRYGIVYTAPADAGRTPFPDASFDAVVTTSVFEHLPRAAIDTLLTEHRRILKDDGLMLHAIDYSDHYAHSDGAIGGYNFLRFSSAAWRFYSPPIHYQNRLRHDDYRQAFARHGLDAVFVRRFVPPDAAAEIAAVGEHAMFRDRPMDALIPTFGYFMLMKAVPP